MNPEPKVDVSTTALVRAWRQAGRSEFWLQLSTDRPDPDTFAEAIQELEDPLDDVSFVVRTAGTTPKGCVALIGGTGDDTQLLVWADALARRLETHGITGTLSGAKPVLISRWIPIEPPVPTAFLTWSYGAATYPSEPSKTSSPTGRLWKPDPDTTCTIAELVTRFARPGGPKTLLRQGVFQFAVSPDDDLAQMLTTAIETDGMQAGLWCIDDQNHTARTAQLSTTAQTVLQLVGDTPNWQHCIDTLRDTITERPDLLDHAVIRTAYHAASSWHHVAGAVPIPHSDESKYRYNQHLNTSHIIDANGIQILTDTHLARLRNPDRWTIEPLGNAKYLVTAPDLAAWYASPEPNPHTLQQARHDFTDLLLTDHAIATNPPPWRPTT